MKRCEVCNTAVKDPTAVRCSKCGNEFITTGRRVSHPSKFDPREGALKTGWTFDPAEFGFHVERKFKHGLLDLHDVANKHYYISAHKIVRKGETIAYFEIVRIQGKEYELTIRRDAIRRDDGTAYPLPKVINYNIPNKEVARTIFEAQGALEDSDRESDGTVEPSSPSSNQDWRDLAERFVQIKPPKLKKVIKRPNDDERYKEYWKKRQ